MSKSSAQTKTIHEFLAENPDVDSSALWAPVWGILTETKDRMVAEFRGAARTRPARARVLGHRGRRLRGCDEHLRRRPARREWLVHSWIGNRKDSILDMNLQVWLGPHIDVPHLILVFGTIPDMFFYSELASRVAT